MDSTDLTQLQRRVRWAYELGRLRRALLGVAPVLVIVAVAACVAHRPISTLWFGLATVFVGAAMLWYGRDPQKAVLPGIAAGLVPLVFALCANHMHACGADGCSSLCVPACVLGGVVAGLAVASVGNQRKAGPGSGHRRRRWRCSPERWGVPASATPASLVWASASAPAWSRGCYAAPLAEKQPSPVTLGGPGAYTGDEAHKMSCPDCRPNGRGRLLWLGIAVAALLAFAYLEDAVGKEASEPASTSPQEIH